MKLRKYNNKGVSNVFGSILFLTLIIIVASTLFTALYKYNESSQESIQLDQTLIQERIYIVSLNKNNQTNELTSALVNNTGTITVHIRAIYINGEFICDPSNPSVNPQDTYINSKEEKLITLPAGLIYDPSALIVIVTERGTKSLNYEINLFQGSNQPPEPLKAYMGPLELDFDHFYYTTCDASGYYNPNPSTWNPGWQVIYSGNDGIVWKVTVTNVDKKDIALNPYTCFTLVSNSGGSQTPYYIQLTGGDTQLIRSGENITLTYIWGGPKFSNNTASTVPIPHNQNDNYQKIFLTFYGNFDNTAGPTYGQTIPFDAVYVGIPNGYPTKTTLNPISSPLTVGQTVPVGGQVANTTNSPLVYQNLVVMIQYRPQGSQTWANITTPQIQTSAGGSFSGTFIAPHAGTYDFRACFLGGKHGSDEWAYSFSASQTIVINQASSSTIVNPLTSTLGQSITATATVTPSFATGTITFQISTDGNTYTQLGSPKTLAGGSTVSDSYTPTAPGSYLIKAIYGGDADVLGSTSTPATLTVNKATPTITTPTLNPPTPITLGQSVTASATVTGIPGIIPTGSITFRYSTDGGSTWSLLSTEQLTASTATSSPYTPTSASTLFRIRADYSGDTNYNNVNSNSASLTVKTLPTLSTPTLTPTNPVAFGTVTASVIVSGSYGTPTGNVNFQVSTDGGQTFTNFGTTKTLSGSGAATSDPYIASTIGTYQFRANYAGNSIYLPLNGPATTVVVNKAQSVTSLTLPSPYSPAGQPIAMTATVTPTQATGTVTFQVSTDGTNYDTFGTPKQLTSGSATSDLYTPSSPGTNYKFIAIYSGDSNVLGSNSSPASLATYGPLDHFEFQNIDTQAADTAFPITITAKDASNNTVANYVGSNTLIDSTGTITPTNTGAFTAGTRTLSVTITKSSTVTTVTTNGGGVSGTSNNFTVNPGALDHFSFSTITSPQTAGTAFTITITAQDSNDNTVTSYTGTNSLSSTNAINPTTTGSFASGIWTGTVTLTTVGDEVTISTTGATKSGTSNTFTISPGSLDHFTINTIGNQFEGQPFSITIIAKDAYNNTATSYTGTPTLTDLYNNINPTSTGTFSNGIWTGSITITTRHTIENINATDGTKTGTSNQFAVTGPLDHFLFNNLTNQVAGTPFSVGITAVDSSNTTITSYTGTNTLTVSTGNINPTTTGSFSNGVCTISTTLTKAGSSITLSTSGATKTGTSNTFNVAPTALDHFTMTGYPTSITAGDTLNGISVIAYDIYNNTKTDYIGQVYFTSTDTQATLPYVIANKYTFTSSDQGSHTFNGFSLNTSGTRTITVRDDSASKFLTSSPITVNSASLNHFTFNTITSPKTMGVGFQITITALDQYNNTVTGYGSSTSISASTGPGTINPASVTFTNGQWTGTVTINTVGTGVTLSASDGGTTGTSNTFTIYGSLLFSSTISPTTFHSGTNQQYTVKVTNLDSTNSLGSITIAIPSGFSVTAANIVSASGHSWSAQITSGQIRLSANAGNDPLTSGQSVIVSFTPSQTPTTGTTYTWTTTGYTARTFGGTTFNPPSPQPQTAIQYLVTFAQSGLSSDVSGTVVTVGGSAKAFTDLPFPIWVDASVGSVSYSYSSIVASSTTGKQYVKTSTDASPITGLTGPATITGAYKTQWQVTFAQSGLSSDVSGTVVTVGGSAKAFADLPFPIWVDASVGSVSYSYSSIVASSTTGKQYVKTSTDASPITGLTGPVTITGAYKTQYYLTVTSSHGTPSGQGWYNASSTAYAGLNSGIVDLGLGTRYVFANWSSDASGNNYAQSDGILMSSPKIAIASWNTEYLVEFNVNPSDSGATTPNADTWYALGITVDISVTPNGAYNFVTWVCSPTIVITNPSNRTTTATINGPGTITANLG